MGPTESELDNLRRLLEMARQEDLGPGDVTARLLRGNLRACGRFVARQEMVFCGGAFLETIAAAYDDRIETSGIAAEGQSAAAGLVVAQWDGPAAAMLTAERVALNFLQQLSGIATLTRQFVEAVADTKADIYDTRKTTPGWRALEKYAVRVGGGRNHRLGLYEAVLIKDNHLAALRGSRGGDAMGALDNRLRSLREDLGESGFVEIEVDNLEQLEKALNLPVDVILLDNFTPDDLVEAVHIRARCGAERRIALEASGRITLANVAQVARSGVDRISVGALTHSAPAVDIGLDVTIRGARPK